MSETINDQNMSQQTVNVRPYVKPPMSDEEKKQRSSVFGMMIIPTAIYAIVYTICIYDNLAGLLMAVFAIATLLYCNYIMRRMGVAIKRSSVFYMAVMILLGISNGTTGDSVIIFFNTVFMFLLIVVFLLHNHYDDSKWGPFKYLCSICSAVFESIPCLDDFFKDASCYAKDSENEKKRSLFGVLIGVAISIPLLAVIISLLYSADIVFAAFLRDTFHLNIGTAIGVMITLIFGFASAYCGMRFIGKRKIPEAVKEHKTFEPVVAITTLSLTAIIYLFFSVIQIVYLFIGNMTLPDGYTYARYAREGFFELLTVCILNVIIVLFVMNWFKENKFIRLLLTIISVCTYVMIASSALRMTMYINAYHLSRLRIMVLWGLAAIAILLIGIIITIYKSDFPLFKYTLIITGTAYLILSFSHMDYFIARYNLSADRREFTEAECDADTGWSIRPEYDDVRGIYYTNYYDLDYLTTLSTDAAPAFKDLPESEKATVMEYLRNKEDSIGLADESLRQFNISHEYVRQTFAEDLERIRNSH